MTAPRRIGLALGGGGARGLAHLHALAAFDELGVRPSAIAGSSIGAIYGAAYAAGFSAAELKDHTARVLSNRGAMAGMLMRARVGRVADMFGAGSRNPVLLDGERLLAQALPQGMPANIEDLAISFCATATDFFARSGRELRSGPILAAIAASAAIPGLFRPVEIDGRLMIDGAMTNPLPYGALGGAADAVVAIDVTGGPVVLEGRRPNVFETMLGAMQILQATIVAGEIARRPPDALVVPRVEGVTLLDFFRSGPAIALSEATKDETKRAIERLLA